MKGSVLNLKNKKHLYFIKDIFGFFFLWVGGKGESLFSNISIAIGFKIVCIFLALFMFVWGFKDIGKNVDDQNADHYRIKY